MKVQNVTGGPWVWMGFGLERNARHGNHAFFEYGAFGAAHVLYQPPENRNETMPTFSAWIVPGTLDPMMNQDQTYDADELSCDKR